MHKTRITRRRRGVTLLELLFAVTISTLVASGIMSLVIAAGRMEKSIFYQEQSAREAQKAIEFLNREIRQASAPLTVVDAGGNPALQGNEVRFGRYGEAADARSFKLEATDGDMASPWDNTLVYDPDRSTAGDEIVVAKWLAPMSAAGAFHYQDATTPLVVQMRAGDSSADLTSESLRVANDARSGPGMQGTEINIGVAPRN